MRNSTMIRCAGCGKRQYISLDYEKKNNVVNVAERWDSCGKNLYCEECSKDFRARNDYKQVLRTMLHLVANDYEKKIELNRPKCKSDGLLHLCTDRTMDGKCRCENDYCVYKDRMEIE